MVQKVKGLTLIFLTIFEIWALKSAFSLDLTSAWRAARRPAGELCSFPILTRVLQNGGPSMD